MPVHVSCDPDEFPGPRVPRTSSRRPARPVAPRRGRATSPSNAPAPRSNRARRTGSRGRVPRATTTTMCARSTSATAAAAASSRTPSIATTASPARTTPAIRRTAAWRPGRRRVPACWPPRPLSRSRTIRPGGASGRLQRMRLKASSVNRAKLQLSGKGLNLPIISPPLPNPTLPFQLSMTAQLCNSDGQCWEAQFGTPGDAAERSGLLQRPETGAVRGASAAAPAREELWLASVSAVARNCCSTAGPRGKCPPCRRSPSQPGHPHPDPR